jgi:hypothetical protein
MILGTKKRNINKNGKIKDKINLNLDHSFFMTIKEFIIKKMGNKGNAEL